MGLSPGSENEALKWLPALDEELNGSFPLLVETLPQDSAHIPHSEEKLHLVFGSDAQTACTRMERWQNTVCFHHTW